MVDGRDEGAFVLLGEISTRICKSGSLNAAYLKISHAPCSDWNADVADSLGPAMTGHFRHSNGKVRGAHPLDPRLLANLTHVAGHLQARQQIRIAWHVACVGFADAICPIRSFECRPLLHELIPNGRLTFHTAREILSYALIWFQIEPTLLGNAVADGFKLEVGHVVSDRNGQLHDKRQRRNGDHHLSALGVPRSLR